MVENQLRFTRESRRDWEKLRGVRAARARMGGVGGVGMVGCEPHEQRWELWEGWERWGASRTGRCHVLKLVYSYFVSLSDIHLFKKLSL